MLWLIIWYIIIGLIIGALGRLFARGPNPIGIGWTIVIGIVASVAAGVVTRVLIGAGHGFISFIVAVIFAAIIVSFVGGTRGRYGRRRGVF